MKYVLLTLGAILIIGMGVLQTACGSNGSSTIPITYSAEMPSEEREWVRKLVEVLSEFYGLLEDGKLDSAAELFTENEARSEPIHQYPFNEFDGNRVKSIEIEYGSVNETTDWLHGTDKKVTEGHITYTIILTNGTSIEWNMGFIHEQSRWRIDSY